MRDNNNKYSDTTDFIYKAKEQLKQDNNAMDATKANNQTTNQQTCARKERT